MKVASTIGTLSSFGFVISASFRQIIPFPRTRLPGANQDVRILVSVRLEFDDIVNFRILGLIDYLEDIKFNSSLYRSDIFRAFKNFHQCMILIRKTEFDSVVEYGWYSYVVSVISTKHDVFVFCMLRNFLRSFFPSKLLPSNYI